MSAATSPGATSVANPARFAVGGRAPERVLRPASREELAEALRAANRDRLAVIPWGGGVGLAHETAPERYDLALDLTALDRIVDYDPEDLTLTAECGATLATLRATLAAHGQELPIEGACAERTTLGGALAGDASGARRMHLGGTRDRILGTRFALADGTLARTGGKVVKNVAGYGIHRLLCGSRGALAVIVEASLKLLPVPEARRALTFEIDPTALADAARWSAWTRAEPAAMTVLAGLALAPLAGAPATTPAAGNLLILGFEGDAAWVDAQIESARRALGAWKEQHRDAQVEGLWQALADREAAPGPERGTAASACLVFASAHKSPAALAPLAEVLADAPAMFHAPHGRLILWPDPARIVEVTRAAGEHGFVLRDVTGPAPANGGEPPVGVAGLRRRIRDAFDPSRVFAFGDRWERREQLTR